MIAHIGASPFEVLVPALGGTSTRLGWRARG
jgi:hypothetical protein